jgi:hypothetical protein
MNMCDIALPAITRGALSPALPVALVVLLVATILFEIAGGRWTAKWRILAVVVSLIAAAVYVLGVAWAFMSLVRDLS